jgi:nitroimidazol reductase NimA-like FMN-containing flavoprotein (pyridoxamine 5'-phosphate oxidase superfamily)
VTPQPQPYLDTRFSEPGTDAAPWAAVEQVLVDAELYWLTTVRTDGRPHVTPLVGLWRAGTFVFVTGFDEQKAVNLRGNDHVAVTTGTNTWKAGHDVVVEGRAHRVTGADRLRSLADAFRAKYGGEWDFRSDEEVFDPGDSPGAVFAVRPDKVLSFAKSPHAQARYTFG